MSASFPGVNEPLMIRSAGLVASCVGADALPGMASTDAAAAVVPRNCRLESLLIVVIVPSGVIDAEVRH